MHLAAPLKCKTPRLTLYSVCCDVKKAQNASGRTFKCKTHRQALFTVQYVL